MDSTGFILLATHSLMSRPSRSFLKDISYSFSSQFKFISTIPHRHSMRCLSPLKVLEGRNTDRVPYTGMAVV